MSSSRSAETSSTASPLAAGGADRVPDRRLRADVDAAGGVARDQQRQLAAHLAADDELLLVAAGQRAGQRVDAGRADVVLLDDARRCRRGRRRGRSTARATSRARSGGPARGSPTAARRAAGRAGGGPRGRSRRRPRAAARVRPAADVRRRAASCGRRRRGGCPISASTSSAWPLPSTPARPSTSPRWMVERDVVDDGPPVGVAHGRGARPAGPASDVTGRLAGLRRRQLAADHELGELAGGRRPRVDGRDGGAAADDRDVVGDRQHLVELVRDEQHREALGLELAQVVEQLVDLLRHEHRGGLVEDEDPGAAVEHLEDLDALALADAEVGDQPVGLDAEAVRRGELGDAPPGGPAVEHHAARARLAAEHDVLEHREVVGEHEVLVHHADAGGDGVAGAAEAHLPAVDADRALVGPLHPVEDLHQRRLAGAVLADEGVDGAGAHAQVDVAVGDHAREALGDAGQLDGHVRDGRGGRWGPGAGVGDGGLLGSRTSEAATRSGR